MDIQESEFMDLVANPNPPVSCDAHLWLAQQKLEVGFSNYWEHGMPALRRLVAAQENVPCQYKCTKRRRLIMPATDEVTLVGLTNLKSRLDLPDRQVPLTVEWGNFL